MLFQSKTSSGFFEDRYQKRSDPWNFAGAIDHQRYRRAFEPGCSIGTLTERLAAFCDLVEASDFSATAVARAQERCAQFPNVRITQAALSQSTKLSGFDLIVLSEIGYYFRPRQWRRMVHSFAEAMDPGATVLASHWLGHSDDHRQSGDQVHTILEEEPLLTVDHSERHEGFRLTRFCKR